MKQLLLLFTAALLFSCTKGNIDPNPPDTLEWETGKNEYNQQIDGEERNFLIHVPAGYDGSEEVPLLFMLHGSTGTGTKFYNISGWVGKAEQENFIAVFPTALSYPIADRNGNLQTKWSSGGLEEAVVPGTEIKDDIPFFRELVDLCINTFSIDEKRIYISGFSNGGGFVKSRILTQMGEIFAAASTGGGPGLPESYPIEGERFVPLFTIVGTLDDKVRESAGIAGELPLNAEDLFDIEEIRNRTDTLLEMLHLDTTYTQSPQPPEYNQISFTTDLSGQGNEMIYIIVDELQHRYPNGSNNPHGVKATDVLWPWYMTHALE